MNTRSLRLSADLISSMADFRPNQIWRSRQRQPKKMSAQNDKVAGLWSCRNTQSVLTQEPDQPLQHPGCSLAMG